MRTIRFFIIVCTALFVGGCAAEINKIRLYEAPKPDVRIMRAVSAVMREYMDKLDSKNQCVLEVDTDGILDTNWHPVQQGTIKRKIQIYVWGDSYRVDVWHKPTFGPFRGSKDYQSRLMEMNLQFAIEKKLAASGGG